MKKLCLLACLSLVFAGCAGGPEVDSSTKCVINPSKDATITVTHNGAEVGFCCKKCKGKWEGMSDADKQTALDKAK